MVKLRSNQPFGLLPGRVLPGMKRVDYLHPSFLDDPLNPGHCSPEGVSTYFRQFAEQLIGLIQRHVPFNDSADFRVSFAFAFHKYASIKLMNRACQDICNNSGVGCTSD